jgi:D-alanine-D-alanine ligase-like ATP-grasp enzyme
MRIGVLRGGTDENYENSLKQGGDFISFVFDKMSSAYNTVDILIDKDGVWHTSGLPIKPADIMHKVDVVWNFAEPSTASVIDSLSIPQINQSHFSSFLQNSREMLREHMKGAGISMPRSIVLPMYKEDIDGPRERYSIKKAKEVHEKFGAPWIIKSFTPNKNMGIHLAKTFGELAEAIEDGLNQGNSILVEEFVMGKPGAVHSMRGFRGEDVYVLPLGKDFTQEEKEKIAETAKILHNHIGAEHYLKTDFIWHPKRGFFLNDIYFSIDFREGSHLHQATNAVGADMNHIVEHILKQAL